MCVYMQGTPTTVCTCVSKVHSNGVCVCVRVCKVHSNGVHVCVCVQLCAHMQCTSSHSGVAVCAHMCMCEHEVSRCVQGCS